MYDSTWRRCSLRVIVAFVPFAGVVGSLTLSSAYAAPEAADPKASEDYLTLVNKPHPTFQHGFATLAEVVGDEMGEPLVDEHAAQADEPNMVIQETTTGLAYWSPEHFPSFFDGFHRVALLGDGSLARWTGDATDPPPLEYAIASVSKPILPGLVSPPGSVWDTLASCESTGNWHTNTGNSYYGGLQEDMAFWRNYGGLAYAARPDLASREAQIVVAQRGKAKQGWSAWPACSRRLGLR